MSLVNKIRCLLIGFFVTISVCTSWAEIRVSTTQYCVLL
jgi:hypothetical protein